MQFEKCAVGVSSNVTARSYRFRLHLTAALLFAIGCSSPSAPDPRGAAVVGPPSTVTLLERFVLVRRKEPWYSCRQEVPWRRIHSTCESV